MVSCTSCMRLFDCQKQNREYSTFCSKEELLYCIIYTLNHTHTHTHACMHARTHARTNTHTQIMHTHTHTHICVYIYIHPHTQRETCICTNTQTHEHKHMQMHTHVHTHTHTHTHTHLHTHRQIQKLWCPLYWESTAVNLSLQEVRNSLVCLTCFSIVCLPDHSFSFFPVLIKQNLMCISGWWSDWHQHHESHSRHLLCNSFRLCFKFSHQSGWRHEERLVQIKCCIEDIQIFSRNTITCV